MSRVPPPPPSGLVPPPPPGAPEPRSSAKVEGALGEYAYLVDTIASLDYEVNSRLASQQQLVNQLASSTARATTELNAAREKTKKEGNDVKGMESGWSLKAFKAAIKGNKAEKMDKEVQQWVAAQEVEKGKEVALATVSAELARETNELNQLKAKQAHSTQLKAQLDQLLERVFSGPTPEFPDEDRLENDVATALRYLNDAARDLPYYQNVLNLLVSAEQEAQQALQALSQASTANTVDMFSDSVGVDIMKQSLLQRGREHADRSNSFLEQARQLMPGLPGIGNVRISGTDMMLDIVFDNVFTDMYIGQKIRNAREQISYNLKTITGIRGWAATEVAKRQAAVDASKKQYEEFRVRQRETRKGFLQAVLQRRRSFTAPNLGPTPPPPAPARVPSPTPYPESTIGRVPNASGSAANPFRTGGPPPPPPTLTRTEYGQSGGYSGEEPPPPPYRD